MIYVLDDATSLEQNKEFEEYFDKQELTNLPATVPHTDPEVYQSTPYQKEIECETKILDDDLLHTCEFFAPVIRAMIPQIGDVGVHAARLNLINISKSTNHTPFHRDFPNDHWVGVYYINDANGDTIVFDDGEAKYIEPKRDRLLFFPGQFHAIDLKDDINNRKILNYCFELKNP
tara:strand:- start:622 stop:1146 length:525 start_codon:yes stop_codon:yes gene_type:complete